MDSSSSSSLPFAPPLQTKYDVFLSFRGEDTRDAFTSHLHKALLRKKIDTYIDNRLEKGDDIGPTLLEAVEKSKIALVIFSKDYASSTWCLKELVHIPGCKKRNNQIVIPIFYRIDPSHVRNQQGTYALAFAKLEERFKDSMDDPVLKWREALVEAANMSGFHDSRKAGTDADFVEEVAQDVLTKLNRESSSDLKGLVGIQRKIEKIESLLCFDSPGVCCVGIWGMGGIGKTTLADAVFHRQRQSSKFEACCFLANVRENSEKTDGLHQLRKKLVGEILNDKDVNIDTPSLPANILIRLRRTKALIVLDDVNARKQLEYLVGDDDRFCQGSRIIITARDKGILEQKVDHEKIYKVKGLGSAKALHLFHSRAFGNKSPTTDYTELSREVVDYVKGNPLALKVMGSSFRRCKSKHEWEVQWKKVKQFPNEEIDQVLRISYDGLGKNEKEIFLDIACFHKGREMNYLEELLDSRGFHGEVGINDLIDRSLISISIGILSEEMIEIHDLVQEMGRAIAREQRSRLFTGEDLYQVLTNNQCPVNLKRINLSFSKHLTEVPNLFRSLNIERIELIGCKSLVEIPSYFQHLGNLGLGECTDLKNLPEMPCNLEFLSLHLTAIEELPSSVWSLEKLSHLDITECEHLKSLPSSTCKLKLSGSFSLEGCESLCKFSELPRDTRVLKLSSKNLVSLPTNIWKLKSLERLDLSGCSNFQHFPEISEAMENLEMLNLSGTKIKSIPASIKQAVQLSHLFLNDCKSLESLPELPPLLQYLEADGCTSLKTVSSSSTAITQTQGWEENIFYQGLREQHIVYNCPELDENARSNIMADAHLRIMRMATASSKFKEDRIEEASYDSDEESVFWLGCSGNEIPNWFSHKSEGCSIKIELPRDWFTTDFSGFALSLVFVGYGSGLYLDIICKYNFKTSNGESHEVNHGLYAPPLHYVRYSHEVFVWWDNNVFEEVVEGAQSLAAFYKLVTEVNVDFTVTCFPEPVPVEKCGICVWQRC